MMTEHFPSQRKRLFGQWKQLFGKVSPSIMWALLFTFLILIWAITGDIKGGSSLKQNADLEGEKIHAQPPVDKGDVVDEPFKVRTAVFPIKPYGSELIIRGRTKASVNIEIKAETAGRVIDLPVIKGTFVKKGTVLCQIEDGARTAAMREAKALVSQRGADYKASQRLEQRGHTAGLKVLQNKALLDQAEAILERAELDLSRTAIKAPFDGFIEQQPAKVGSYLSVGGTCAELVSLDPLTITGAVRERDVPLVRAGMKAKTKLVTGETAVGTIIYIAAAAEEETRTFRVDLLIENPGGKLRSGVTADILIPLPKTPAMLLPPSIMTLSDDGEVGVRLVGRDKQVQFYPVSILSEQQEGIWVKALPLSASVITVGQDFVKAGQSVEPTPDPRFDDRPGS